MSDLNDVNAHEPQAPVATPRADLDHARLRTPDDKPVAFTLLKDAVVGGITTTTCPQCGLNPGGAPKKRKFQYVPPWVYIGLLINLIVLLVLVAIGRKTVATTISLCDECDAADRRGRMWRALSVVGAILGPVALLVLGLAIDSDVVALGGLGVGLVGGITGAVVTHLRTRADVITCKKIDKVQVTLCASPSFPVILQREAPHQLTAAPVSVAQPVQPRAARLS